MFFVTIVFVTVFISFNAAADAGADDRAYSVRVLTQISEPVLT